jgi:multimeric flavodoxin WrbA
MLWPMTQISIVYFSQFKGSTERLAQAVARGASTVPGTDVALISVDQVDAHWARLHASDAIVFGTPTYIGSVAAKFKEFIEKLAGEVWLERMWVNNIAAGFTVSAGRSGDKLSCLQQLVTFAAQMGMIWVPLRITGGNYSTQGSEDDLNRMAGYLGVMAQANIDEGPEVAPPPSDIKTAELHGHHIANVTRQFAHGRREYPADYDAFVTQAASGDRVPLTLSEILAK